MEQNTSEEDSLMSEKYVDEDSWTFFENPIDGMSKK